jgi:hypothetical protein
MTQVEQVIIHVRFAPSGAVTEIGERPEAVEPQDWFNALTVHAGGHYQPLAGGRGVFRLTRDKVSKFQQQAA